MRNEFLNLYERELAVVVKFLLTMGASRQDAEDAAQEAFTEAWRALVGSESWTLMDERARRGWLRQVARRCYLRPPGMRRRQPLTEPRANQDLPEAPWQGHADLNPRTLAVVEALNSLQDQDARAVIALGLEGFSVREIAEILNVGEQRVLDLRKKARRHLASRLARTVSTIWEEPR